ncbi:hypothetical protein DPMN_004323 [Dreissena polymorpha]|uniref:Uncharacterized protein n=1 Tax=Dreissena polymorpha TaxID=45954 RepID=A0A9D4RTG5_DREPO|nr:hypothetical protein DPMN_004323 [Dreissena polymorpha]
MGQLMAENPPKEKSLRLHEINVQVKINWEKKSPTSPTPETPSTLLEELEKGVLYTPLHSTPPSFGIEIEIQYRCGGHLLDDLQLNKSTALRCGGVGYSVRVWWSFGTGDGLVVLSNLKLSRYLIGPNVLTKFHKDCPKHVAYIVKTYRPGSHVFQQTGGIFKLSRAVISTSVLTKFHFKCTKNETSRVLTRKNAPPPSSHTSRELTRKNFHEDWTKLMTSRVTNINVVSKSVNMANVDNRQMAIINAQFCSADGQ